MPMSAVGQVVVWHMLRAIAIAFTLGCFVGYWITEPSIPRTMTKSIADLQAGRRATRDWKRAVAIIIAAAALGFLAAAVFAQTAHAQVQTARVTTKDSVRITVVSARKVDTLIRVVHDTVTKLVVRVDTVYLVRPADSTVVTPPIVLPPDTTHSGSPAPQPGDVTIWSDNFDARTSFAGYGTSGQLSLVSGRGGSGKAMRCTYSQSNHDCLIEKNFPATTDLYFRYWYRITPTGWLPFSGITGAGWKWFMPWRAVDYRITCGVGQLTVPNWAFFCHDNTSGDTPNATLSKGIIPNTPRLSTTNDGAWHEYVLHVKVGAGGYEQSWVDGVKVFDSQALGLTHSAEGISMVQFPGLLVDCDKGTSPACSGVIEIDDFVIWRKA